MKFYCDACNTKYAISDEKVRGKVLKVRCKNCDTIITVREARTPAGEAGAATSTDAGVPQSNWYFAVNGVTTGPLGLKEIKEKFESGEVGDEAYVWHDTFDKWEPVSEVETFKAALASGQALKPRAKTLGFTGKLQAVKAPAGPNKSTSGAVPSKKAKPAARVAQPSTPLKQPSTPSKQSSTPAKQPSTPAKQTPNQRQSGPREDKLAALRAKLKQKKDADAAARPAVELPKTSSKSPASGDEVDSAASKNKADEAAAVPKPLPTPSVPEPAPKESKPDESKPAALATPPSPEPAKADQSDLIPDVAPAALETPTTTSTSDIFEIPAAVDEDELDDSDAVPFFPPAAVSSAAPAEQSALTGSLLIQLDQIQKKGRGSKFFAVAVIILFLGSAVAIGSYIYSQPAFDGEDAFTKVQGPGSGEHRELNFRTYSDDQHRKILELGDEELTMEFDESEAGEVEGDKPTPEKAVTKKSTKVAAKTKAEPVEATGSAKAAAEEPAEKSGSAGKPLAMARIKDSPESSDGKPSAEDTRRKAEMFRSATSDVKRESTSIARPQDKLQGSIDPNATLTREQALAGMKRVSRSVQLCRERHMRRGGTFDSQKIFVTVTVKGDGRVSDFDAEPRTLSNTEFGRCMNSHKGRWRFAAFGGKPQQVRRRFIIQ